MKCFLFILFLCFSLVTWSQKGLLVKSGYLKIYSGSIVEVNSSDGNLNTAATGTVDNGGTIIVDGYWNNLGVLNANDGTIKCAGNFTSNGTQNESTSTVELNGAANQVVAGSDLTFHDLTINNSSGDVNLSDNASVSGTLTLTSGDFIIATAKSLSIDDTDDPGISGGSATSHIVTAGTGVVQDVYSSTTKITYPMGDGTSYRPVSLTPSVATAQTWTVSYTPTAFADLDVDAGLDHVSTEEYWNVNRNGAVDAILEFTYGAGNAVDDYTKLRLAHYDGATDWDLIEATAVGDNTSGVITTNAAVTSFSPFTLASITAANPLPIELVSFSGYFHVDKNAVVVNWTTASEKNNDYFTVEKSSNALDWQPISGVKGAGNSNVSLNYQYFDTDISEGIFYYRLKQTDFDGTSEYSDPIAVTVPDLFRIQGTFIMFPNPTNRFVNIDFKGNGQMQIIDNRGVVIVSKELNEHNHQIDLQGFAKGMYTCTISTMHGIYCKQLIVQ